MDAGTTANGVFGCKLMWPELCGLLSRLANAESHAPKSIDLAILERRFPQPRFVWVQRERVAQALSWAKAIQTGYWHHWDELSVAASAPTFDHVQVQALVREISENEKEWELWFADNEVKPLVVRYEDLAADPDTSVRKALGFIGIDFTAAIPAPRTVKVGDSVNTE